MSYEPSKTVQGALAARDRARAALQQLTGPIADARAAELATALAERESALASASVDDAGAIGAEVLGLREAIGQLNGSRASEEQIGAARHELRRTTAEAARAASEQHRDATAAHFTKAASALVDILDALDAAGDSRCELQSAVGFGVSDEREGLARRLANDLAGALGVPARRMCPAELRAERRN